jgi:hypothetical protein
MSNKLPEFYYDNTEYKTMDYQKDRQQKTNRTNESELTSALFSKIQRRIDSPRNGNLIVDKNTITVSRVKDIDWQKISKTIVRSGVIIYFLDDNNQLVFGMGEDNESGNITDFGGSVSRRDLSPLHTGLREFNEETLGVFGKIDIENTSDSIVVYSRDMMIIFLHLEFYKWQIQELFKTQLKNVKKPEVKDLVWLTQNEWLKLIQGLDDNFIMYYKVKDFLYETLLKYPSFISIL